MLGVSCFSPGKIFSRSSGSTSSKRSTCSPKPVKIWPSMEGTLGLTEVKSTTRGDTSSKIERSISDTSSWDASGGEISSPDASVSLGLLGQVISSTALPERATSGYGLPGRTKSGSGLPGRSDSSSSLSGRFKPGSGHPGRTSSGSGFPGPNQPVSEFTRPDLARPDTDLWYPNLTTSGSKLPSRITSVSDITGRKTSVSGLPRRTTSVFRLSEGILSVSGLSGRITCSCSGRITGSRDD